MHRRSDERWTERDELTTDDLERMLWARLRALGPVAGTGEITCEWVDHPGQRHKLLREQIGGINPYRVYCQVQQAMRFHSTEGNFMDEGERFRPFRSRPDTPPAADGLEILMVGELAYNPERVLALEERRHQLYGLWMPNPYWYNYVGPLPFGHVIDLDPSCWTDQVHQIKLDVIYALLNWQAVPFIHQVMAENPGIPVVWHFKEGPFICPEHGCWEELLDITSSADRFIAGWLHGFVSRNGGDLRRADWDDLNLPARMATLAVAGLPMIQRDNSGARVPIQTLCRERGLGIFYTSIPNLAEQLSDGHHTRRSSTGNVTTWIAPGTDRSTTHGISTLIVTTGQSARSRFSCAGRYTDAHISLTAPRCVWRRERLQPGEPDP